MNAAKWYRVGLILGALSLVTMLVAASGAAAPSRAFAGPTISSFTPHSGPIGTQVTFRGNNLQGASVWFDGVPASVNVTTSGDNSNNDEVTAPVPAGATTGVVTVKTKGGMTKSAIAFTVTAGNLNPAKGRPIISSFRPATATAGSMLTISGENFGSVTYVKVGGVKAKFFKTVSGTTLSVRVPAGAKTGKISVVTPIGAGTSGEALTIG
jgi:IPT/TIG domain